MQQLDVNHLVVANSGVGISSLAGAPTMHVEGVQLSRLICAIRSIAAKKAKINCLSIINTIFMPDQYRGLSATRLTFGWSTLLPPQFNILLELLLFLLLFTLIIRDDQLNNLLEIGLFVTNLLVVKQI
jgi:hypothetical protein